MTGAEWKEPSIWPLTAIEAMLVLRCALLGPTRERCKDCEGGTQRETKKTKENDSTPELRAENLAWHRERWATVDVEEHHTAGGCLFMLTLSLSRPCPTCTGPAVECDECGGQWEGAELHESTSLGSWEEDCSDCDRGTIPGKPTGYLTTEQGWAERWLRARPQECDACDGPCAEKHDCAGEDCPMCDGTRDLGCARCSDGERATGVIPGDPEARKLLTVLADELLGKGDPLGLWLSLWLAGVPCGECEGHGPVDRAVMTGEFEGPECGRCHGSGLELGHHVGAMSEAGEDPAWRRAQHEASLGEGVTL